jgi:hypothetical protein
MHLAFVGTLDRRWHFKHFSLKQSRFTISNEHGSQVKDEHKKFPYRPTHDVSLLSGYAS